MILDGNMMSTSLIILEGKYVAIDTDDSWCHGYYIIKFSSSPYNLQVYMSINYHYYVLKGLHPLTQFLSS